MGNLVQIQVGDPALLPESLVYDLVGGSRWEEVAVAVLREGYASAWGAESYFYNWHKPEWALQLGTYIVEVRVESQSKEKTKEFRLAYTSHELDEFRLVEVESRRRRFRGALV
ncbi:MAG TPA: hypothetical protein VHD91_01145 [Gaiellaceae bacterium]|nr:hypothetical protein [Gaiellaceae bacterium]